MLRSIQTLSLKKKTIVFVVDDSFRYWELNNISFWYKYLNFFLGPMYYDKSCFFQIDNNIEVKTIILIIIKNKNHYIERERDDVVML